jgi:hypothetical protein
MNDLTFIVQGPVDLEDFDRNSAIQSIKKYFPNSKIIVSTWGESKRIFKHNENITVVTNVDPGPGSARGDKWAVNFTRQVISTLGGLLYCETKYACKIRSDCYFASDCLVAVFFDFIRSKKRLLFTDKSFRFPYYNYAIDWFQIGLTKDLINVWEKALKIDQKLDYFKKFDYHFFDKNVNFYARYHSEQLIYIALHPDKKIVERDYRPKVFEYLRYRINFNKEYYTIGKINVGLMCSKYANKINDYKLHFKRFDILLFVFPVLDLMIGVVLWFHYMYKVQLRKKTL